MNKLLIWLLERQIKDGWLPLDWFYASARLFGEPCLELCIFRQHPVNGLEAFLFQRDASDPFYSLMYHVPGTRKIAHDTDEKQLRRTIKETPFHIDIGEIQYSHSVTIKTSRGTEFADIRYVFAHYNPTDEGFFPVDDLPRNTIPFHVDFIQDAVIAARVGLERIVE